jgi:hypothetical protein
MFDRTERGSAENTLTRTTAEAYNCDLPMLGAMVSDDLEFYHDQTEPSAGKVPFIAPIRQNVCGKVARTIVPGSMVYPLKGYGAVQIGVHRFHHPGHPEMAWVRLSL